jgi:glutamyl-tRNA synthetase
METEVRVRIAPSPTGYLHIGTARTALFNYLFAKKTGGKFLLRIEDTDIARNTEEAYNSILNGLSWLGLNWEEEVIYQKERGDRHLEYAKKLIESGHAYYCYLTEEEVENRKSKILEGRYIHRYSKGDDITNNDVKPVIRMKIPSGLDIIIDDAVQGKVVINTSTIEDFVIVRASGTPVYMLSVVCDDIDMKITHVLRGDDHLTNTAKQILIYQGLKASLPVFGHIPLIHGMDGKKLSKRHGALAIEDYKRMGYLPQALRSYLVRLGFGTENNDILTDEKMIQEFNLEGIGRSPAKFDFEKLKNINHFFIQKLDIDELVNLILEGGEFREIERIKRATEKTRYRYSTLKEMKEAFKSYEENFIISSEALQIMKESKENLIKVFEFLKTASLPSLEEDCKAFLKEKNIALGKIGPALRCALTGSVSSTGIFEIIYILGLKEALKRIEAAIQE